MAGAASRSRPRGTSGDRPAMLRTGGQPPRRAADNATRAACRARADAGDSGIRTSGVGMRPSACSSALTTAGLGSANSAGHERQQRLGVRRGPGATRRRRRRRASRRSARWHRCDGGGDRARAAHQHRGEEERVVAAEHREAVGHAGQQGERVGVQRPTACFRPRTLSVAASSSSAAAPSPRPVRYGTL